MTFLCLSGILGSAADKMPVTPIREAAGFVIIPFQNGINQIGAYLTDCLTGFQNVKKLSAEKEELEQKVTDLTEENNQLVQEQQELQRLQELYQLDQSYSEYEKVAAQVISKDPGNWYDTFVINKGSNDGIQKDMNVIADGGLVGLVEEVSSNSATVRSIIDDSSSVSAMTASTSDTCIVSGDLRLISDGKLAFSQLNTTDTVAEGEKIVTSNISDKYLRGILIGYVSEITEDSNHLTKKGYIIPVVDFQHIQEVLVILTSAFGLMRGKKEGLMVGFFSGLMIDLFYGSLFGFYALLYMYIGYLNGFFCKVFYDDDIKVHIVLVAASDLVYSLLMYVLQFLLRVRLHFFDYLAHIILPEMVYTVVLSILLYRLLFIINRKLTENEMEGQQSPWLRR